MTRTIDFLKTRYVFIVVSVVVVLAGIGGTVAQGGFNLGVDFQPGLRQQVAIDPSVSAASLQDVRSALSGIDGVAVQSVGDGAEQRFSIRIIDDGTDPEFTSTAQSELLDVLRERFGVDAVLEEESALVGPQFSASLAQQAVWLTTVAFVLILFYVWIRFRFAYAVSSILPIIHDVIVLLGFIGAFQIEVSTATVAAVLTVVGYSLNDTIVIFDRIRENELVMRGARFEHVINTSITQSLTRTLITSMTTLLAVLAILVFATGTIQDFALALLVGVIVGTYSSVFVAAPTLLALQKRSRTKTSGDSPRPRAAVAADAGADKGGEAVVVDAAETEALKEEIRRQKQATQPARPGESRSRKRRRR
ncbi:MAG: protein translocase subunit SecF [Spirochaetaceae bacterium]